MFLCFVDNGSFDKATDILGIAQLLLSQHIKNIETQIGRAF